MGERWQRRDSEMVRRQLEAVAMGFRVRFWRSPATDLVMGFCMRFFRSPATDLVMGFNRRVMDFRRGAASSNIWFFPMDERWQRHDGEMVRRQREVAAMDFQS
ncbi:hypothetical protein ACLOJK_000816 [Asimina triloba]